MNPRIREVTPSDDYKLKLVFTNGEQGIYDYSHLLNFGVFKELKDLHYFKQVKVWTAQLYGRMSKIFAPTPCISIQ